MYRQRGFVLIELMVGAILATLLAVWAGQALVNRIQDAAAQGVASWMQGVRHGVAAYLERYGTELKRHGDSHAGLLPGYQDWTRPTLAELKADGLLHSGFSESIRPVGTARIHVLRAASCPQQACRLDALVYADQPFLKRGAADEHMLAQWLLAMNGDGAAIFEGRRDRIQGRRFEYPNPPDAVMQALPAGTVVLAVVDEEMQTQQFVRIGDDRDPHLQGDLTVAGQLRLGDQARRMTACAPHGVIARDDNHELLICRWGVWHPAFTLGGAYMVNSHHGCQNAAGRSSANPVTRACSCPPGQLAIQVSEGVGHTPGDGTTRGYVCVS